MVRIPLSEDMINKINLTKALESHNNYCTLFAVSLLSMAIGWDAEMDLNSALLALVNSKKRLPMKDLLDATGLSKRDYLAIFGGNDERRSLKSDDAALARMSDHLKRQDLLPRQRALSKLIWKRMQREALDEILLKYYYLTDRFLEDDYRQEKAFQFETYDVKVNELNEAMRLFFLHIYEIQAEEGATC